MNYIISMQVDTRLSFGECISKAYEEEKEALHQLQEQIRNIKVKSTTDKTLLEYIDNLDIMQVGYMSWHERSSRYISSDGKSYYH